MSYLLYIGRWLDYISSSIRPEFHQTGLKDKFLKGLSDTLNTLATNAKRKGELQVLNKCKDVDSAENEMDSFILLQLCLYVEGYMASTAYRAFPNEAPNPIPPDLETRSKWGLKHMKYLASQNSEPYVDSEGWKTLSRIYNWIVNEEWNNPYWEKAPDIHWFEDEDIENEEMEEWEYWTDRASRLDDIIQKRRKHRIHLVFENRHLLQYD